MATGNLSQIKPKVVSLLPSLTRSVIDLGFGDSLTGVTNECVIPDRLGLELTRVGSFLAPETGKIISLKPDFILVDPFYTPQQALEGLPPSASVRAYSPITIEDMLTMLWEIAEVYQDEKAVNTLLQLERSIEWTKRYRESLDPTTYFCPLWKHSYENTDYWLTFNSEVYAAKVAEIFNGKNCAEKVADQVRNIAPPSTPPILNCYQKDSRFFWISSEVLQSLSPSTILIPNYPYPEPDLLADTLSQVLSERPPNLSIVDGAAFLFPGTAITVSLNELDIIFKSGDYLEYEPY